MYHVIQYHIIPVFAKQAHALNTCCGKVVSEFGRQDFMSNAKRMLKKWYAASGRRRHLVGFVSSTLLYSSPFCNSAFPFYHASRAGAYFANTCIIFDPLTSYHPIPLAPGMKKALPSTKAKGSCTSHDAA